jgi:hypothetical protein
MEFSLWGCLQKDIDQKEYFWSMMFFSDYTLLPPGSRKGKASQKVRLLFLSFTRLISWSGSSMFHSPFLFTFHAIKILLDYYEQKNSLKLIEMTI